MKRIILFLCILLCIPYQTVSAIADSAGAACLMNSVTGEVVFEKNSNEKLPMASTTKIMTLLVALDKSEPDDMVTISQNAVLEEGSSAYLESGIQVSMRDLSYGLMLNSGNDAAVAIAEHISGSTEKFAEDMTKLARKIGARNTCFKNPNGLDEEGHFTTARDLALITRYALKNDEFREVVSTRSYTAQYIRPSGEIIPMEFANHNRLLREYDGCIGVKTGFTKKCGRCLVSAARRGDSEYIVVTLNDPNDWKDHKELLELGFAGTHIVRAVSKGDCVKYIKNGNSKCEFIAASDYNLPLDGDKSRDIKLRPIMPETVNFSLNAGEKVGVIEIYCDDTYIDSVDIVASCDFIAEGEHKSKHSFWFRVLNMLKNIL